MNIILKNANVCEQGEDAQGGGGLQGGGVTPMQTFADNFI